MRIENWERERRSYWRTMLWIMISLFLSAKRVFEKVAFLWRKILTFCFVNWKNSLIFNWLVAKRLDFFSTKNASILNRTIFLGRTKDYVFSVRKWLKEWENSYVRWFLFFLEMERICCGKEKNLGLYIWNFVNYKALKSMDLDQHLAGHAPRDISSGPDSDPNKNTVQRNRSLKASKIDKAKGKGFYLNLNLSLWDYFASP